MTTPRKRYRIVSLTDGTVLVDTHMSLADALKCASELRERLISTPLALSSKRAAGLMLIPDDGEEPDGNTEDRLLG